MTILSFLSFILNLFISTASLNIIENFVHSNYLSELSESDLTHLINHSHNISIEHPDEEFPFIICIPIDNYEALHLRISKLENFLGINLPILSVNQELNKVCMHALTTKNSVLLCNSKFEFDFTIMPSLLKVHSNLIALVHNNFKPAHSLSKFSAQDLLVEIQFSFSTSLVNVLHSSDRKKIQTSHLLNALNSSLSRSESFGSFRSWSSFNNDQAKKSCDNLRSIDLSEVNNIDHFSVFELRSFLSYPIECFKIFIENLANNPHIIRLALKSKPKLLNHIARGIIQTGKSYDEPYSAAGLNGKDQIVGVADTGLNDLSCFFYDDIKKNPTPRQMLNNNANNINSLSVDKSRRKVIQYVYNSKTDGRDYIGGHGTHVSGSIVGNCLGEYNSTNGMAPEAKIAFFDIGASDGQLWTIPGIPSMLQVTFNAGARVHSNSWGAESDECDAECVEVDNFQCNNPNFLTIFAAGNEGATGLSTLNSPNLAKNTLTVGAATTRMDPDDVEVSESTIAYFSSLGPTKDDRYYVDITAPGDYVMSAMAGNEFELYSAIISSNGLMQSRSVMMMSGTSMATPITAGAALLIRQYFMDPSFWNSICNKTDIFCKAFEPVIIFYHIEIIYLK
jgi:hypothetical protein